MKLMKVAIFATVFRL